jgi:outer membrane lipoprotein-sorting protein
MKKIVYLIIICLSFSHYSKAATKESVHQELINIYKHVTQVSFEFTLLQEKFKGYLTAKSGNKYKMVVAERIIISNGKTIWNYSEKENKVVISDFEELSDQVSIDKIFFSFLNTFKPAKLSEATTSKGVKSYILTLKADEKFKSLMHISTVDIWVDMGTYDIIQFEITEPQKMTWIIDKMKLRKKSDDSIFEFKPNDSCTVIDLR